MSIKISGFSSTGGGGGGSPPLPRFYTTGVGSDIGNGSGSGMLSLPYDSTVNFTTPLFIVTCDKSGGNGYMSGAGGVSSVQNGGAANWLYMWLSMLQLDNPQTDTLSNNAALNGNYVAFCETLRGVSSVPNSTSSTQAEDSNATSISANITVFADEFIVLATGTELGGGYASSVSFGGLTFTRKCAVRTDGSPDRQHDFIWSELWYAYNNTGTTINDNITVNWPAAFDDGGIIVTNWAGVDSTNPWL